MNIRQKFHWKNEYNEILKELLLNDGKTVNQIADYFGCSVVTVRLKIKKLIDAGELPESILKRKLNISRKWSTNEDIELEKLYYSGKTRKEIAKEFGRTYASINCRITFLGLADNE